jgi:hypothetical protein
MDISGIGGLSSIFGDFSQDYSPNLAPGGMENLEQFSAAERPGAGVTSQRRPGRCFKPTPT